METHTHTLLTISSVSIFATASKCAFCVGTGRIRVTVVSVGRAFINVYDKSDNKLDYLRILIALTGDIYIKMTSLTFSVSSFYNKDT